MKPLPPLEWLDVEPDLRAEDSRLGMVTFRLAYGIDMRVEDKELRDTLVSTTKPAHAADLANLERNSPRPESQRCRSQLDRVVQLDESNAVVTYKGDCNPTSRPYYDANYTFIYALIQVDRTWRMTKTYRMINWIATE